MIIKGMKKLSNSVLNIILAAGLIFLMGGFLSFVYALETDHGNFFKFWPFFVIVFGAFATYFSITVFHKSYILFGGILFLLSGCFMEFLNQDITSLGYSQLWPVFLLFAAVALVLACIYKFRRPRPNYIVPSVIMVVLSVVFLLFSLDIIAMPFVSFMMIIGPCLLFATGITAVILFIVQSTHKEFVIPEEDADNDA